MKNIQRHFSTVAAKYREIRTTDKEPIRFITKVLPKKKQLFAADVGCGAGRYDLHLFNQLGDRLFLYCIDANKNMLRQLQSFLKRNAVQRFRTIEAYAHEIPLPANSLDSVFTFNAIHHFRLPLFFREVYRVLTPGGKVFIYTRLPSQNKKTIWGKFFPSFSEKETRLYNLKKLKSIITATGLKIKKIKYFKYERTASLGRLIQQVENKHYSTFYLYPKKDFAKNLSIFKRRILLSVPNPNRVRWHDENVLLILKKNLFKIGQEHAAK